MTRLLLSVKSSVKYDNSKQIFAQLSSSVDAVYYFIRNVDISSIRKQKCNFSKHLEMT